jgi:Ca2+/Na+ antiporter|eukprot:CAMPEP_0174319666 /NCGR_PEP_ID=MMETSP0810-20121108/9027_1 /TAXON_ID=73025 ORGANISM="Eutreptiella gymnastica-like, Strain CCMP1594" /NCGR_SAMPLE_ID=MMETSP0810 /ASSEMBLY_ACC=CAM_ASM_000659 /LENGTH=560 /DNA_ID=CAMNT_0015430305 /DNA_START=17 /DNA_END=1699 /DNA_ORIENTATION=+
MGDILSAYFIEPKHLPEGFGGSVQVLSLGVVYGYILFTGSNLISEGSELLLLIPSIAGIVGSVVLPILGAVPDGAIVLFSGMGPNAQEEVSVGVGALAGSTIMLLTVPWCLSIIAGRVNCFNGEYTYKRPASATSEWKRLDPPDRWLKTGVKCDSSIKTSGRFMLMTAGAYLVIQIPAFFASCGTTYEMEHGECHKNGLYVWAILGLIMCIGMFIWYLHTQIAESDEGRHVVLEALIDKVRQRAVRQTITTLRALYKDYLPAERDSLLKNPDWTSGDRMKHFLRPFFNEFDTDRSGAIGVDELQGLLVKLGEKADRTTAEALLAAVDKDKSGFIEFDEFLEVIGKQMQDAYMKEIAKPEDPETPGLKRRSTMGRLIKHEEEEVEEDAEMPEDLTDLSPEEQRRRILMRSAVKLSLGTGLVLLFSDPMVGVMSEMGSRCGISPFYISFVLAPLASNASELISAYVFAAKKTPKTMTISFSALLGAATMNNTFCLGIFFALIAFNNLAWAFSAETISILFVEACMYKVAQKTEHPTYYAFLVLLLYPISLAVVAGLEGMGFD